MHELAFKAAGCSVRLGQMAKLCPLKSSVLKGRIYLIGMYECVYMNMYMGVSVHVLIQRPEEAESLPRVACLLSQAGSQLAPVVPLSLCLTGLLYGS